MTVGSVDASYAIPAADEHPQGRLREAVARAAEPVGPHAGRGLDRVLGPRRAPRRARPPSSGAARARVGTSGSRSRGRRRRAPGTPSRRRREPRRARPRRTVIRRFRVPERCRAAAAPSVPRYEAASDPTSTSPRMAGTTTGCRRRATGSRRFIAAPLRATILRRRRTPADQGRDGRVRPDRRSRSRSACR